MRILKPKRAYFFAHTPVRSHAPISNKYGFDRGTSIDRYYINHFMELHKNDLRGACLEVHDAGYIEVFGGARVTKKDVLDINIKNPQANIRGDLRNLQGIVSDNSYDCFVLVHTLGLIDDYEAAINESWRILKPGGVLLFVATVNGSIDHESPTRDYWRFTPASLEYVFGKKFGKGNLEIQTYGNVLSGQAHWVGLAAEELSQEELDINDPYYPIVITMRAVKRL